MSNSSDVKCSKQRKETWDLFNVPHVQVSYILKKCMLFTKLFYGKKNPGEVLQYTKPETRIWLDKNIDIQCMPLSHAQP